VRNLTRGFSPAAVLGAGKRGKEDATITTQILNLISSVRETWCFFAFANKLLRGILSSARYDSLSDYFFTVEAPHPEKWQYTNTHTEDTQFLYKDFFFDLQRNCGVYCQSRSLEIGG